MKLNSIVKNYLWGGRKLKDLFGKSGEEPLAESWEVSVHKDGQSYFDNGLTLADYIKENEGVLGGDTKELPILIKLIDAKGKLSVQVHPNDEFARKVENDNGKTEMWYIVQADKGAGIYCGLKQDTKVDEFLAKVNDGTVEELLNFIPVKKGDCFLIEAGTVHAIGAGCLICEVQQSSNVTYRVYDYKRVGKDGKERELHVDKAVKVINFKKFKDNTNSGTPVKFDGGKLRHLTTSKYFDINELTLNGEYKTVNENSFIAVNVLEGECTVNGEKAVGGDSFFIPCGKQLIILGKAKIILSTK